MEWVSSGVCLYLHNRDGRCKIFLSSGMAARLWNCAHITTNKHRARLETVQNIPEIRIDSINICYNQNTHTHHWVKSCCYCNQTTYKVSSTTEAIMLSLQWKLYYNCTDNTLTTDDMHAKPKHRTWNKVNCAMNQHWHLSMPCHAWEEYGTSCPHNKKY